VIQQLARVAVEVGSSRREPSRTLCDSQLATLVGGGSAATSHCFAATALLTRGYQGDYRRQSLPSAASRASSSSVVSKEDAA
jgi:hypothetical protein